MLTPRRYAKYRALCSVSRTMRSALAALLLTSLPQITLFLRAGVFTLEEVQSLGLAVLVAALMVLFNYLQRLRERPTRTPRRARQQQPRPDEEVEEK